MGVGVAVVVAVEAEEAVPFMLKPVAVGAGELWLAEGLNGAPGAGLAGARRNGPPAAGAVGVVAAEEAAAEALRRALWPPR